LRLWRALPWESRAADGEPGGALWFPRHLQGDGRHDNPDLYGCLYTSETPVSAVAEQLAPFRGSGHLQPSMLVRLSLPLALAALELPASEAVIDLDDPAVLAAERLRPSQVATRSRRATQAWAASLYAGHDEAVALRWWSVLEGSWINVTLFDRAASRLTVEEVEPLGVDHQAVAEAADFLGLL
jgi:hypothetical protein